MSERSSGAPAPGSVWQEKRPDAIIRELDDVWRRLVRVESADPDGFVEGVGWWQEKVFGHWQDTPRSSRKTRVRTGLFLQRYEEVQS